MSKGVLVDVTRCVGCGSCAVACKLYNGLEWKAGTPIISGKAALAAETWTDVERHVVEHEAGTAWRFVKTQCFHCLDPACASACFVSAFKRTPEGPVVYNEDICVGCRYCMLACPFSIPKYEWDRQFPRVRKCQMCFSRIEEGQVPACVAACPTEAIKFGKRSELLEEAHRRIKADPSKYIDHVYGETEVGGTSWLYISDVPFKDLGFRTDVTQRGVPQYTWDVLKWTPHIAIGWTAVLTALYVYTKRRSENEDDH
jgi:formate dehydrogenase iron-sulfur subunit